MLLVMLLQPPPDAWRWERAQPRIQWGKLTAPVARAIHGWWRSDVAEKLIFAGASPEVVEAGREKIRREAGIIFNGDAATIRRMGVTVTLTLNREAQEITALVDGPRLFRGRGVSEVRKHLTSIGLKERG